MPCLQHRKTDLRLTSCTRCHASSDVSSTDVSSSGEMPALLKSTSTRPNSSRTCAYICADGELLGDVDGERQVAGRALEQVDADHLRALARERLDRRGADAAGRTRDHAHLALEATRHRHSSVA